MGIFNRCIRSVKVFGSHKLPDILSKEKGYFICSMGLELISKDLKYDQNRGSQTKVRNTGHRFSREWLNIKGEEALQLEVDSFHM